MHYGMEARSPFLDHHIWEFAAKLPTGIRLHHGVLKAILRQLTCRRIGSKIGNRQKRGFTVPVDVPFHGRRTLTESKALVGADYLSYAYGRLGQVLR